MNITQWDTCRHSAQMKFCDKQNDYKAEMSARGPMVKRLRHHPFTVGSGVRFPLGLPFSTTYSGRFFILALDIDFTNIKKLNIKIMLSIARVLYCWIKYIYIFKINFRIVFGVNWACNFASYFMTNPRLNDKLRNIIFLTSCYKCTAQILCFDMKR